MISIPRAALFAMGLAACSVAVAPTSAQTTAPGASPAPVVGRLEGIKVVPNVAGARCGNHLELTVLADGGKRQVLKLYDPKVHASDLQAFAGKKIEVDLLGDAVQNLRLAGAGQAAVTALANLATRKLC
jgi:hypothetical protein